MDASLIAFVGVLASSVALTLGAYWAGSGTSWRRTGLVLAVWILVSVVLWDVIVARQDWSRRYIGELFSVHVLASIIPSSVALALARFGTPRRRWTSILGAVALVVALLCIVAFPSAVMAGCMLDQHCDP